MDYAAALFDMKITTKMLDRWRGDLSKLNTTEEQQDYYDSVIAPVFAKLDEAVDYRHSRHRDDRDIENLQIHDERYNDLIELVYAESPDFLHELAADPVLCRILKRLTPDQKEVLYNNAVLESSVTEISVIKKTSDRNIRKTKEKALRHIRGQMLPVVMFRYKIQTQKKYRWLFVRGVSATFEQRMFAATIGENYTDYYEDMTFDFVEITRDYRAQEQRIRDNTTRLKDEKRRYKELMKKKSVLQKQIECGNINETHNSYEKGVTADYAQNI